MSIPQTLAGILLARVADLDMAREIMTLLSDKAGISHHSDPVALWRVFQARAEAFAGRPAIRSLRNEMSFDAVYEAAGRIARHLDGIGVCSDSTVALSLPNTVEFVPALLAAFKCSATVVLVSPKYRASELQAIGEGISPRCFVTAGKEGDQLHSEMEAIAGDVTSIAMDASGLRLLLPDRQDTRASRSITSSHDQPALIKLTSGSTGVPKGIALSVGNVLAEAENVVSTLDLTSGDQILVPVPLAHSYGFDLGVLAMLSAGASLVVRDTFVPRQLLADLAAKETTVFLGIPSIYRTLVDIPISSVPDLSHLRYLLSCTAPLHPDLIANFHDKFGVPICQHYGSSETGGATTHVPDRVLNNPTSVGLPMHKVDIRVVDAEGTEQPPNQEGEVVISSDAVALGYVMGGPSGDSPFEGNAYWSGDLGFVDDGGLLYLTGRKSEIINVGGLKVSPSEVVQVLERLPEVKEAVVVGVPSASGDEMVCAVVASRAPMGVEDILAHCRDNLADYKVPRRIEIRDELPRGPTGKVKLTAADLQV